MESQTQDTTTTEAVCYRHPGRETAVSCSNCERPICTDCMVYTPVGIKCPECARQPRSAIVRLRPDRAARAIGAAFAGGLLMGLGIVLLQGVGLFFALILGWLIGIAMGELVLRASGRYRGPETGWIAIAGCVWTYVVPYGLFYGVDVGDVARSGSLLFVLLGAGIACYVAYQRTQ
ncbi:MAG: hypothetical protein ACRDLQ_03395 [Solirubrobacterales bacterium]